MTETETEPLQDDDQSGPTDGLGLSHWLWRPWYAKLWWAAIPVYWLVMGEPTRPEFLNAFADSGYAVVTNVIFIPITALAVLTAGSLCMLYDVGPGGQRSKGLDLGCSRKDLHGSSVR